MGTGVDEERGLPGLAGPWESDMRDVVVAHGARLAALAGRRLTRSWVVWDLVRDRWFADGPVVLDFDGERLEFAATRSDEISVCWNTIDVTVPIGWSTSDMDLVWREDGLAALARHRGARVLDARVSRDSNGCAFTLDTGALRIFNAGEEVGVRDGTPPRGGGRRPTGMRGLLDAPRERFERATSAIHRRRELLAWWVSAMIVTLVVWRLFAELVSSRTH